MGTVGTRYSAQFRANAVSLVLRHRGEFNSQSAVETSIATKLGCSPTSLRGWVNQAGRHDIVEQEPPADAHARIVALELEVQILHQTNEILRQENADVMSQQARDRFRRAGG